jgi:prepilin-type N-terminal cleavage/methylation domain-containing protein
MIQTTRNSPGFTLIELLIVVAIIAILAAIAVPNFLEAQVRSKVARTQSDIRSMAVAVESYHVDFNQYPLPVAVMSSDFSIVYPMPSPNHNLYAQNFLPQTVTTPIAYITTIFSDVFADASLEPSPEQQYIYYQNWEYTRRLADAAGASFTQPQTTRANAFGSWIMSANGPDLDRKDLSPTAVGPTNLINGVYNATNGTVSNGDVIRTQRNPSGFTL